ncbi:MAG: 4-(cytidine 5'-diphospho)-2-C-methyl-D-erythritol kinase [Sphingobium sp.]
MTVAVETLSETAFAKINLALHVRARRPDGYHEIETLFAFVDGGDRLRAEPADNLTLTVSGPFAGEVGEGEDNLVVRAAMALADAAGGGAGARIMLDKMLPVAAGLGGGSADAAAALRLLVRLWGINPATLDFPLIARTLGADVPACLASATLFGTGVGERLEPVDLDLSGRPVLLVNPRLPCPTGPVFAAWDGVDQGALDPEEWQSGRNDLEEPARRLVPEIGEVLAALAAQPGAVLSRMSGSGATCFALFGDARACDMAETAIRAIHPGWWTMTGALR